jgi:hypothetical protein
LFTGLLFLVVVALSSAALADRDRTQVGHTINIGPDEEVGDATCFGCSIRVRGHVSGDVTAFGGSVVEEEGQIGGDATVFGGRIRRDPAAAVGGDVTTMGGRGWIFLIFLIPLILLGLFIALIVWIIRRLLRPSVPVAA